MVSSGHGRRPSQGNSNASKTRQYPNDRPPWGLTFLFLQHHPQLSHKTMHHQDQAPPLKRPGRRRRELGSESKTCSHCGRSFKRTEHLERHLRTRELPPYLPYPEDYIVSFGAQLTLDQPRYQGEALHLPMRGSVHAQGSPDAPSAHRSPR